MMRESLLGGERVNDEEDIDSILPLASSTAYDQQESHESKFASGKEPNTLEPKTGSPATQHLHRQGYVVWLVLIYAAMLITAWAILIVTSRRPIGRGSYGCFDSQSYCRFSSEQLVYQNSQTARYIRNAQTLLSAVSLLTIPLTSAVCAAGVIPWWQEVGRSMTLRQVITLADKGWTSPYIYYRLLAPTGWKRYGSSFIALALLLHAVGAVLSPAISQLSSLVDVKVPTKSNAPSIPRLISLHDLFDSLGYNDPTAIVRLRAALNGVSPSHIQPQIWVSNDTKVDCNNDTAWTLNPDDKMPAVSQCRNSGLTYMSLIDQPEAWVSQLGYGFATGVKSNQYIPRVNTSVNIEFMEELPDQCTSEKAVLLMDYAGKVTQYDSTENETVTTREWWAKVCILHYPQDSGFNDTDDAQTLVETAFLDLYNYDIGSTKSRNVSAITMSTTVGYFELPNYNNNNVPGPLLQNFQLPSEHNFAKREQQHQRRQEEAYTQPSGNITSSKNSSQSISELETLPNKGPLLKIIYALFGNGSMPSIFGVENATYNPGVAWSTYRQRDAPCLELVPLSGLNNAVSNTGIFSYYPTNTKECVSYYDLSLGNSMLYFLSNFFIPTEALTQVLRAAAYISHDIWLSPIGGSLSVDYDPGQDLQRPGLTRNSIIGLSLAIAVFLFSLLLLAFYASFSRTWTYSLDAYALLRMGAELGRETLPFVLVSDTHVIGEFDELPGWVGDVTSAGNEKDDEIARELGMAWNGTERRKIEAVRPRARYISYPKIQSRKGFDVLVRWCNFGWSLGGTRQTRVGQKILRFRRRWKQSNLYHWLDKDLSPQ